MGYSPWSVEYHAFFLEHARKRAERRDAEIAEEKKSSRTPLRGQAEGCATDSEEKGKPAIRDNQPVGEALAALGKGKLAFWRDAQGLAGG